MDTISTATIIGIAAIFVLVVLNVVYAFKIRKCNKVKVEPNTVKEEEEPKTKKRKRRKSLLSRLHKKPDSSSNIWK